MDKILHKNVHMLDTSLINYFRIPDKLKNMYTIKSKAIKGISEHDSKTALCIDIIENEIIGILEKDANQRTNDEKIILHYANSFYTDFFKTNKLTSISCKLYQDKKIADALFDASTVSEIGNYKKEVSVLAHEYYNKLINNGNLTDLEYAILFEFLTSMIGTQSEKIYNAQKNVIKVLLDKKENYHITAKNFLLQFITHEKCKDNNMPDAKVYIGNKDFYEKSIGRTLGMSYGSTGLIMINENFLKLNHLKIAEEFGVPIDIVIILVVLHELEHYKQDFLVSNGIINTSSINSIIKNLLRKHLTTTTFDEFNTNYFFVETEREANIVGWRECSTFLKKYSSKEKMKYIYQSTKNEVHTFLEQKYAVKKNSSNRTIIAEEYNIRYLVDIIKKNPHELKNYPQLKLYFNDDGSLKKNKIILKEYTKLMSDKSIPYSKRSEIEDAYDIFLSFSFSKIDFSQITLTDLTSIEQYQLFSIIQNLLTKETRNLKQMLDIYSDEKKNVFNNIAIDKIKRINKYFSFLKENQDIISNLSNSEDVSSVLHLRIENLNSLVHTFENRAEKLDGILDENLIEEIRNLSYLGDADNDRKRRT